MTVFQDFNEGNYCGRTPLALETEQMPLSEYNNMSHSDMCRQFNK